MRRLATILLGCTILGGPALAETTWKSGAVREYTLRADYQDLTRENTDVLGRTVGKVGKLTWRAPDGLVPVKGNVYAPVSVKETFLLNVPAGTKVVLSQRPVQTRLKLPAKCATTITLDDEDQVQRETVEIANGTWPTEKKLIVASEREASGPTKVTRTLNCMAAANNGRYAEEFGGHDEHNRFFGAADLPPNSVFSRPASASSLSDGLDVGLELLIGERADGSDAHPIPESLVAHDAALDAKLLGAASSAPAAPATVPEGYQDGLNVTVNTHGQPRDWLDVGGTVGKPLFSRGTKLDPLADQKRAGLEGDDAKQPHALTANGVFVPSESGRWLFAWVATVNGRRADYLACGAKVSKDGQSFIDAKDKVVLDGSSVFTGGVDVKAEPGKGYAIAAVLGCNPYVNTPGQMAYKLQPGTNSLASDEMGVSYTLLLKGPSDLALRPVRPGELIAKKAANAVEYGTPLAAAPRQTVKISN